KALTSLLYLSHPFFLSPLQVESLCPRSVLLFSLVLLALWQQFVFLVLFLLLLHLLVLHPIILMKLTYLIFLLFLGPMYPYMLFSLHLESYLETWLIQSE